MGRTYAESVGTPPLSDAAHPARPDRGATPAATAGRRVLPAGRARRIVRFVGTALIVVGVGAVAWSIVVWRWQDPFTALYTTYQQHQLSGRYHKIATAYRPLLVTETKASPAKAPQATSASAHATASPAPAKTTEVAREQRLVALDAKRYRQTVTTGAPLGRIKIRRIGLNIVLVTGTDHDSLTKGPGWDQRTYLPGSGRLVYIAGHRTTYLAPFSHIDSIEPGDLVTIDVPYGTFVYRVRSHVVVPSDDLSRLRSFNRPAGVPAGEVVALQACHPRFFATHRYIVYAVLVHVEPKGGAPYNVR